MPMNVRLAPLFILIPLVATALSAQAPGGGNAPPADQRNLEKTIATQLNDKRKAQNLPALEFVEEIAYIARQQANEFERLGLAGHEGKEWGFIEQRVSATFGWNVPVNQKPSGRSPAQDMMTDNSFDIGEEGHLSEEELHWVIDGWMQSPGHRAAIMMETTAQTGVGISDKGTRIFHIFASLSSARMSKMKKLAEIGKDLFGDEKKAIAAIKKILALNEGAALVRLSDAAHRSSSPEVRKKACEALYQLNKSMKGIKGVVPELIDLVNDAAIGADALKYLKNLTGKSIGQDKQAWLNWWSGAMKSFSAQ